MILYQFSFNIDPDNLLSSVFSSLGGAGRYIAYIAEALIGLTILIFIIYWFILRRQWYPMPVHIYEIVGGQLQKSREDKGGFRLQAGGGQLFTLMPRMRSRLRVPILIQPRLEDFSSTVKGYRYINYLRLAKDIYAPMKFNLNAQNIPIIQTAQNLDLSAIENQLTANYLKFRGEGWWSKYGNQAILIVFAMVLGIFLFLVAKEFTQTAYILNEGQVRVADAIENLGKQVVN